MEGEGGLGEATAIKAETVNSCFSNLKANSVLKTVKKRDQQKCKIKKTSLRNAEASFLIEMFPRKNNGCDSKMQGNILANNLLVIDFDLDYF